MLDLAKRRSASTETAGKARGERFAILQFDASNISLLRVLCEGEAITVLGHASEQGPWVDEDGSLEAALKRFTGTHLEAGETLYSVLPRYEITTRLLELPGESDDEIDGMLRLNAEEHVPYAADELVIRHATLQKLPTGESLVLAVFARNNVVDDHLALLKGAGLEPEQILLSTACLLSAAVAGAPVEPERFALAHVASGGLEVAVLDERKPVYLRGVSMPHGWPAVEDGIAPEDLITELRASMSTYRRESVDGRGVEHIYVSSDWADTTTMSAEVALEIGKEAAAADFLRGLVSNGDALPVSLPAVLLGGALTAAGKAKYAVNLLPEHVRQARQMSGLRVHALRVAALVAVLLLLTGAAYLQRVWQYDRYIAELEKQARTLAPQAEGVVEKQAQLNIIARQVAREGNVLDQLGAIVSALPEQDINITRFDYDRESGIELWGRALTVDDVSQFATNVRMAGTGALGMLRTAHRMYEQQDEERGKPIMLYHVAIPISEGDEGEATNDDY